MTPAESFSDEEKELDRKLEKRKRELLEVIPLSVFQNSVEGERIFCIFSKD